MNFNMTLTCDTCEQDIDCRIGMSNREIQPLSFACPHCTSLINITLEIGKRFQFSGAQKIDGKQYGLFDGRNPFIDLHLDFPAWFNDYVPGDTPFMIAMEKIKGNDGSTEQSMALMQFHAQRLNQLNLLHQKSQQIRTILKLYHGHNKQLFKKRVEQGISEWRPRLFNQGCTMTSMQAEKVNGK